MVTSSVAEIAIGILCACLPAFSVLFNRVKDERSRVGYASDIKMSRLRQVPPSSKDFRAGDGIIQKSYIEVGSSENVSAIAWQGEQWARNNEEGAGGSAVTRYSCHIVSER